MSIEERVENAIEEFRDLVANGQSATDALRNASASQGLKPGVLEHRLSRKMPLDALVVKILDQTQRTRMFERILTIVSEYLSGGTPLRGLQIPEAVRTDLLAHVEVMLGHPLPNEVAAQVGRAHLMVAKEVQEAFEREFEAYVRQTLKFNHDPD